MAPLSTPPDACKKRPLEAPTVQVTHEKTPEPPAVAEPQVKQAKVSDHEQLDGWQVATGERAAAIRNPIREIMDTVAGQENPSKTVISLAQGDPSAYPHLRPSKHMVEAVVAAVTSGQDNGYQPSQGNARCRAAVAQAFSAKGHQPLTAADVFMSMGCSEALSHSIAALAGRPGGNMLLPRPGFPLYDVLCQYHGVEIRYYDLLPDRDWEIDVKGLDGLVDKNTRALIINNPSNPCGAVYSRAHLTSVLAACERFRLPVIADEVYAGMSFSEPYVQCAEVTSSVPVLSVCALSKKWLAPGWRVGWVVVHDAGRIFAEAGVQDALLKLCQVSLGPCSLLQAAVPEIVLATPQDWFTGVLGCLQLSASCCARRCRATPGLEVATDPQGSMYMMVRIVPGAFHGVGADDVAFARGLLREESVAVLPGKCFNFPGFFRVVFAAPPEVLEQAWDRIEAFCRRQVAGTSG
jgi:tyrosine aminotransferase